MSTVSIRYMIDDVPAAIKFYPLTPEEALRRAMRAPVPSKADYKPPEKPKPTTKGKKVAKKKG